MLATVDKMRADEIRSDAPLTCDECGCREGEQIDPLSDPEWDECCDRVLCERCWFDAHVRIMY